MLGTYSSSKSVCFRANVLFVGKVKIHSHNSLYYLKLTVLFNNLSDWDLFLKSTLKTDGDEFFDSPAFPRFGCPSF